MAAIRIIDDHLELANIGSNTHAQIDTHIAAADNYVKRDGSLALTVDWDIGDTRKIKADEIRARDAAGLKLYDDGGNGIFIEDGGDVGIGTAIPTGMFHISNDRSKCLIILQNGYIGIGKTPTQALDVKGIIKGDNTFATTGEFQGDLYKTWSAALNLTIQSRVDRHIVFEIEGGGTEAMRITSAGNVSIGTTTPTAKLDVNSDIFRLRTAKTPATAGAAGNTGDMCGDANYFYRCVSTNSWKRAALNVW